MIQYLTTTFYKASKYRCSSPALWQTPKNLYNRCIQVYSNIKTHSEFFITPKKYVKHSVKPQSSDNLFPSNKKEKLSRPERGRLLKRKKLKDDQDRLNHPNYNPFSSLLEEHIPYCPKSPNMANKLARINFRTMLNSSNNVDKAITPPENGTKKAPPSSSDNTQAKIATESTPSITLDSIATTSIPNEILHRVSEKYAPKNQTFEPVTKFDHDKNKDNNDTSFALVFRIEQKKDEQLIFHEGRILTSIITSFQRVMPYIRVVPLAKKRDQASDIESPEDIQLTANSIVTTWKTQRIPQNANLFSDSTLFRKNILLV
jgi:hypothetical protein